MVRTSSMSFQWPIAAGGRMVIRSVWYKMLESVVCQDVVLAAGGSQAAHRFVRRGSLMRGLSFWDGIRATCHCDWEALG
jgi:hypothetical protein